jgi:hypothetical protein
LNCHQKRMKITSQAPNLHGRSLILIGFPEKPKQPRRIVRVRLLLHGKELYTWTGPTIFSPWPVKDASGALQFGAPEVSQSVTVVANFFAELSCCATRTRSIFLPSGANVVENLWSRPTADEGLVRTPLRPRASVGRDLPLALSAAKGHHIHLGTIYITP